MLMLSRRAIRWDESIAERKRTKALVRREDPTSQRANVPSRVRTNHRIVRRVRDTEVTHRRPPMDLNLSLMRLARDTEAVMHLPTPVDLNLSLMRWARDTEAAIHRPTPMGLNLKLVAGLIRQIQGRDVPGDPKAKTSTTKVTRVAGMPQANPVLRLHQT
jgi:hypothetical protein